MKQDGSRWETARWASGKLQPASGVVALRAAGVKLKILSASSFSDLVCIGGKDSTIRTFDFAGNHTSTLQSSAPVRVLASCEQQQTRWLASAGGDKDIRLWNVVTGKTVATSSGSAPLSCQFDRTRRVPTMEFFRASDKQPAPSLLVDGNFVVDWRPDGTAVQTMRHNLNNCGATSLDEPSIAYGASGRGICRLDMREPPPSFDAAGWPADGYAFEGSSRWAVPPRDALQNINHAGDIQWLKADSTRIVGASPSGGLIWDVRRLIEPVARIPVASQASFENTAYREIKDVDLASRGRLIVTTFNILSANQALVSLFDLSDLGSVGVAPTPVATKMRLPKPCQTRSIVMSRLIGRQTVVTLTPSSEVFTWTVGSKIADDVGLG